MLISVVPIGNSRGIRLPKAILKQLQISDQLDLEVKSHQIILKPVRNKPRTGWTDAFKEMHERNEDTLLIDDNGDSEGFDWEW